MFIIPHSNKPTVIIKHLFFCCLALSDWVGPLALSPHGCKIITTIPGITCRPDNIQLKKNVISSLHLFLSGRKHFPYSYPFPSKLQVPLAKIVTYSQESAGTVTRNFLASFLRNTTRKLGKAPRSIFPTLKSYKVLILGGGVVWR